MVAETGCNQRHFEQIFTNKTEAIANQFLSAYLQRMGKVSSGKPE